LLIFLWSTTSGQYKEGLEQNGLTQIFVFTESVNLLGEINILQKNAKFLFRVAEELQIMQRTHRKLSFFTLRKITEEKSSFV